MSWIYLVIAGILEVVWAVGLKQSAGFTRWGYAAGTLVAMALSVGLLALALRGVPLGTGYAVWTGIGTVGTALVGILVFQESAAWPRLLCLGLIVCGIVGLRLLGK